MRTDADELKCSRVHSRHNAQLVAPRIIVTRGELVKLSNFFLDFCCCCCCCQSTAMAFQFKKKTNARPPEAMAGFRFHPYKRRRRKIKMRIRHQLFLWGGPRVPLTVWTSITWTRRMLPRRSLARRNNSITTTQ